MMSGAELSDPVRGCAAISRYPTPAAFSGDKLVKVVFDVADDP